MVLAKPKAKADLAKQIVELLDVEDADKEELIENLNKMSKTAIKLLCEYVGDQFESEGDAPDETPKRVEAKPPVLFTPQDIDIPKNPVDMGHYLNFLPEKYLVTTVLQNSRC